MQLLFITAGIVALLGCVLYIIEIYKDKITINLTTWTIRFFIEIINTISYLHIVNDRTKGSVAISGLIGIGMILILGIYKGNFKKPDVLDIVMFACGIATIVIGIVTKDYIITNIILQIAYVIGYIPTIVSAYTGKVKEKTLPRIVGTIGAGMSIAGLLIFYESRVSLAYPVTRGLGNIGVIIAIILHHNKSVKSYQK